MKENTRTVGDFIVTEFEREMTDSQLKAIESDNVIDAENLAYLDSHRKVPCLRIEHRSGIWTMEVPVYCMMYHCIMAFGENEKDEKAFNGLLSLIMENGIIVGDDEYIQQLTEAKKSLQKRTIEKIDNMLEKKEE